MLSGQKAVSVTDTAFWFRTRRHRLQRTSACLDAGGLGSRA